MKTILIFPQDIIPNCKYINDANGRHDLLGQILYSGFDIHIPPKTRTPQELKRAIHPFTKIIRQYVFVLTPLSLALLDLSYLPGKRQIVEANKLLKEYDIFLVTEEHYHNK